MATYYKYQPRDPQADINWAEVSQNLSDVVKDEVNTRVEAKAAVDQGTRDFQKLLDKSPQGESDTIRNWGIAYSDNAREVMLVQDKLLKNGGLSQYDYTQMRQNLLDGTENAFSLIEDYQAQFANKMERFKSQDPATASQKMEVWLMENAEGFANFNQSELVINPQTGKVSAGFREKNAKTGLTTISSDPNDLVAVSSLRGQITGEFNKYDVEKATSAWVESTGAWTEISKIKGSRSAAGQLITSIDPFAKVLSKDDINRLGLTTEETEITNLYLSAENDWIKGQLTSGNYNTSSVLTDFVKFGKDGKEYSFTFSEDEAKADGDLILLSRQNGTVAPVFDASINPNAKKQEDQVYAYMRTAIRNKVNREKKAVSVNDYQRETAAETNNKNAKNANTKSLTNTAKLFYGNDAEVKESIDFIRSSNKLIDTIDRDNTSVIITYTDGRPPEEISFLDPVTGQPLDQTSWVTGAANFFSNKPIENINTLLKSNTVDLSSAFNNTSVGFGASNEITTESKEVTFKREMDSALSVDNFITDLETEDAEGNVIAGEYSEDKTKQSLIAALANIPGAKNFKVTTTNIGDDEIAINDAAGKRIVTIALEGTVEATAAAIEKGIQEIKDAAWATASTEPPTTSGLPLYLQGKSQTGERKRTSTRRNLPKGTVVQQVNSSVNVGNYNKPKEEK